MNSRTALMIIDALVNMFVKATEIIFLKER
jgi:hypothetical protein